MATAKLAAEYAAFLVSDSFSAISDEKLKSLLNAAKLGNLKEPITNLISARNASNSAGQGGMGMTMTSNANDDPASQAKMTAQGQEEGQMGMTMTAMSQEKVPNPFEYRSGAGNRIAGDSFDTAATGDANADGNMGMACDEPDKPKNGLTHVHAAYVLVRLGGNTMPTKEDIREVLTSVGISTDDDRLEKLIEKLEGKDIDELVAEDENGSPKKLISQG